MAAIGCSETTELVVTLRKVLARIRLNSKKAKLSWLRPGNNITECRIADNVYCKNTSHDSGLLLKAGRFQEVGVGSLVVVASKVIGSNQRSHK